ncbi:BnaC04g56920D [Brassica napus]|uniref:(rape) hypothetical protein n=1 Tax=Brassica napus TaxID=3708 RepID=A0A078IYB0_BRANA|nr:unnamed protein product [Brassica napus]CDY57105.1 BnaC04g56920D [Brassica napus]
MDIENLSTILEHQTEQEQSSCLGSKEPKISYVYSSDLKRAFETAQIIAAKCGTLEILTDPDLRERHLGDMQGLVYQEASKLRPEAYKAFSSNCTDVDIPGGGESLDKLYDRCTSALQRIGNKHQDVTLGSMLIGADPSHVDDRCIRVTVHHCFFDGTRQRQPRLRFGKVHLYNNYTRNWGIYIVKS